MMQAHKAHTKGAVTFSDLISLALLALIIAAIAYYVYTNRPCTKPITYDIGTFDTHFGISQSAFISDAAEAANIWNTAEGHTVLAYSATGTMPVNLIYDSRQQLTDTGQSISDQEQTLEDDKTAITQMQAQYTEAKQQLQEDEAAHKDIDSLNREIDALNAQADQIQSSTNDLNAKINAVNSQAQDYNTQTGTDFQEGEYIYDAGSQKINIYEFMDHTQLVRVLAHEFGHSLGLGHNSDPESIMYPENTATNLSLSTEDQAALTARCTFSIKNFNPFAQASQSSE